MALLEGKNQIPLQKNVIDWNSHHLKKGQNWQETKSD